MTAAVAELPTPTWLLAMATAARELAHGVSHVFAGSSWQQPAQAARDAHEVDQLATRAESQIRTGIDHIGQYLVRIGEPGVDVTAARWQGAAPGSLPATPEATLAALSAFARGCMDVLRAEPMDAAGRQLGQSRSRMIAGHVVTPPELAAAGSALGQAQQSCVDAAARIAALNRALEEYHSGALGAGSPRTAGSATTGAVDSMRQ